MCPGDHSAWATWRQMYSDRSSLAVASSLDSPDFFEAFPPLGDGLLTRIPRSPARAELDERVTSVLSARADLYTVADQHDVDSQRHA